jgi:hypothetical protein
MIELNPVGIGITYRDNELVLYGAEGFDKILIVRENASQMLDILVEVVGVHFNWQTRYDFNEVRNRLGGRH